MTRRQKRGEERRAQVLDATLRVLAREGPRGVTHRAVAREAGTPVRATTYYFASRDDLLSQALDHYATAAIARFDALAVPPEALAASADLLGAAARVLAQVVVGDVRDDRDGLVAEYELLLEIGRQPALEPTYRRWQERLLAMLTGYCAAFGTATPDLDARLLLAALRGLELEALAGPSRPVSRADLERAFRRLIEAVVGPGAGD